MAELSAFVRDWGSILALELEARLFSRDDVVHKFQIIGETLRVLLCCTPQLRVLVVNFRTINCPAFRRTEVWWIAITARKAVMASHHCFSSLIKGS